MQIPLYGASNPELLFIQTLLRTIHPASHARNHGFCRDRGKPSLHQSDGIPAGANQARLEAIDALFHIVLQGSEQFSRCGWRRRAQIRNEIRYREVCLVPYSGDYRYFRSSDRPRYGFGIEGGQIFRRTAAPRYDDSVDVLRLVEVEKTQGNFRGSLLTLHSGGIKKHGKARMTAACDI